MNVRLPSGAYLWHSRRIGVAKAARIGSAPIAHRDKNKSPEIASGASA